MKAKQGQNNPKSCVTDAAALDMKKKHYEEKISISNIAKNMHLKYNTAWRIIKERYTHLDYLINIE